MSSSIPGGRLAAASWGGTAVLGIVTVPAVLATDHVAWLSALVALPLFVGGAAAMLIAFFGAVGRSRFEAIGMGGLYMLAGSAPKEIQRSFMWSLGIQAAIGFTGAALRPYTAVAFGILATLWGLGIAGVWGARYGTFAARQSGAGTSAPPQREAET